uniref:Prolactin receptor n=1 Tax=Ditylenchus dipsaci TaxID=166011 RepID=A0A915EF55_9BILA
MEEVVSIQQAAKLSENGADAQPSDVVGNASEVEHKVEEKTQQMNSKVMIRSITPPPAKLPRESDLPTNPQDCLPPWETAYGWPSTGQSVGLHVFPRKTACRWPFADESARLTKWSGNQPGRGNQREFWQSGHLPVRHRTLTTNPAQSSATQHFLTSAYPYLRESVSTDPCDSELDIQPRWIMERK